MLLIVSLALSYTWSKHTLMGSVPFILYFIVNGISSNIKWRMSAVWEKQKNQYKSRLHIREARSWGCQALQSLLGQMRKARQWARKGTPAKHPCGNKQWPGHSTTILSLVCKEGVPRHTWCTDTHAAWLWAQHYCYTWGHPQFRQHTWVELPSANWLCPRLSVRRDPRGLEEWEKQWQTFSLNLETDVSIWAGAMPRLRCGQTHVCLKNCAPEHVMVLEGVKQSSEAAFHSWWGAPDSPLHS